MRLPQRCRSRRQQKPPATFPGMWTRSLQLRNEIESCVNLRLNQQSFARLCGQPAMDFAQEHFVHGDVFMTDTTAGMHALQTRCKKQRDYFRGQSARCGAGRENLNAFGGKSGFFEKFTLRGVSGTLVAAAG